MTRWYPPKHAPAPASFNAEKVRQAIELATVLMAACAAPVVVHAASPDARGTAFFETKIRPLLMARCYECHSASSAKLGGKLSLDSRRGWQAGGEGGQVIVPGKPDESRLIKAVQWTDDEVHMPPRNNCRLRKLPC